MDISEVVSVRKFREFNAQQKEELYETLLELAAVVEDIPKRALRKTFEVTLAMLQYKGELVRKLQDKLDAKASSEDDSRDERLLDENEKLKQMLSRLEDEKRALKDKIRDLTDEIFQLQKRIQEAAHTAITDGSDKDSSDPLSELDKQEELLRNINTKNKHIKRLLREIEALQNQNIEQSKTIIDHEKELQQCKAKLLQLSADITLVDSERKALKDTVNELNIELTRLEGNITYLEEEREKSDRELKDFIEKLEMKAQSWKSLLDEKDKELKRMRVRLERAGDPHSHTESTSKTDASTLGDEDEADMPQETTKLLHAIEMRDKHIEALEHKIKTMAEEMLSSTELMNKLSAEQEEQRNPQKLRACCKTIEESLQAANERCCELSEMLERAEEDNVLKSQQALQATVALDAYQRGEDGLVKALRRCAALEQKIVSRDKQIQALIMELNSMHEITHENDILRKRLNIPDDMVISAKNLTAKARNKDKIIERLTLKLRASEEMRLQLKLEKSDLRKELLDSRKDLPEEKRALQTVEAEKSMVDSLRLPSEVGEVEDSTRTALPIAEERNFCTNCKLSLDIPDESNQAFNELQIKYQDVLEENEILRLGMHEILEKLREYDASSDHISIDTEMLYRLLEALRQRSAPGTPKRLQAELQSLKAREEALRALLKQQPPDSDANETDELISVESMREDGELHHAQDDLPLQLQLPNVLDSSTRPTTPNKSLNQSSIPIIVDSKPDCTESVRELEQHIAELEVYRKHYKELKLHMAASDADLARRCAELTDQLAQLELALCRQKCSYAFMREDYDRTLSEAKQNELQHIQQVADLKQELSTKQQALTRLESEHERRQAEGSYGKDEYLAVQKVNAELRAQLAHITEQLLSGQMGVELQIPDICTDYGVIKENLQLDYITEQEYAQQCAELKAATERNAELERKTSQLGGLLEIAQDQIQSQQKLLNEITDNHINLRHLVADLQSSTEEKLLLAKMQRDLDKAKQEVENLRLERDALKQKHELGQMELGAKEQQSAQQLKDFQTERSNKDIKIQFLQKSLFVLKEKYTKFTPLIFLNNFVFAYTKFVKKTMQTTANANQPNLLAEVQEWAMAKLEECNIAKDESQHLIKLIKAETQCRLLEAQCSDLQSKCDSLQEELLEQRVRYVTETEHWHTIEALFSRASPTSAAASTSDTKVVVVDERKREAQRAEVATNTDVPVPAERKLSTANVAAIRRKSLTQLVDKNMSPIGSPIRRIRKADAAVQTAGEMEMPKLAQTSTEEPKQVKTTSQEAAQMKQVQKEEHTGPEEKETAVENLAEPASTTNLNAKRRTTEALVQTVGSAVESQSVQTEALTVELNAETAAKNVEQTLQDALDQANERQRLLNQSQADLATANKRIGELAQQLADSKSSTKEATGGSEQKQADLQQQSGIIEKTIMSFHTLLSEKDKSISKYQDLLQTEREQMQTSTAKLLAEIEGLKSTVLNLNFNIKTKDMEIMELKTQLESVSVRRNSNEKLDLATAAVGADDSGDNSLNELTDEKIEEMFQQDTASSLDESTTNTVVTVAEVHEEKQDMESLKEIPALLKQIKELKDKASYSEKTLKVKEDELMLLREKLNLYQERDKSLESMVNPEIEQLRLLLEEKDKHINELTETLNNFHDDQQRYIKDSSNYSADQITKLAADLTRIEATNKIYQTQVDALRRQVASLTQREKQARELNQSLRNQLIKRPVVSIKTELNARVKNENMQKRIQALELELDEARTQIHRQQMLLEAKRAKSASEVGMWEKQKRWQQNAEKYKAKFEESEAALEKTRSLLQSARNMITRLEKEKQVLEVRLGRAGHGTAGAANNMKCCRTPSCPNLHHGGKYTPSESPETYTGASSECSSPARSASGCRIQAQLHSHCYCGAPNAASAALDKQQHQSELIEALKARIELQQRKILAMELEGRGTNALTTEMEKLQEKLSEIEAQNIRLEAKNLQLQLDNDMQRQGDATERLQKRIKYLEDYIIALKEEMAGIEARRELCKCSGIRLNTQLGQSAEQTILSLRSIVEKLRAENKFLKDGRRSCESRSLSGASEAPPQPSELSKLQKMYAESVDKISALQTELNMKAKCTKCSNRSKLETHVNDELAVIKEQLSKKTQLLQKAKVLLTRAAAKEKILKEQLSLWKRKCSELQNVPVIDEISE